MLEKGELPFKRTLHSLLGDENDLTDIPFLFSVDVEPVVESSAATHSTQLRVPLMATVKSVEVNSVMFRVRAGSASRKVYLLLQRLDYNGRPRGPPVPLAITDTTQCTASVRFRLNAGDNVRLLLVQKGSGACVQELTFNGFLLQSPEFFFGSDVAPAALASWKPDGFHLTEGERLSESRKRVRPPDGEVSVDAEKSDDDIPTLIYAPVYGGDDES